MVAAFQLPTWREQHTTLLKLQDDQTSSENQGDIDIESPWSVTDPNKWLSQMLLPKADWYTPAPQQAHLRDLRRRVVQTAARLATWRQLNGEFPNDLESILTVDGFSLVSPTLLVDPFNELQLGYERQGSGFVLYSVGPNMKKDGSGFEEFSISELDFTEQSRPKDDHIWRWSPAN